MQQKSRADYKSFIPKGVSTPSSPTPFLLLLVLSESHLTFILTFMCIKIWDIFPSNFTIAHLKVIAWSWVESLES